MKSTSGNVITSNYYHNYYFHIYNLVNKIYPNLYLLDLPTSYFFLTKCPCVTYKLLCYVSPCNMIYNKFLDKLALLLATGIILLLMCTDCFACGRDRRFFLSLLSRISFPTFILITFIISHFHTHHVYHLPLSI